MSSFAGIPFRVFAVNDHWFPSIELDDSGKYTYQCQVLMENITVRTELADYVTLGTWKRPLGTISPMFHLEAGKGDATLAFPLRAGLLGYANAVLVGMTNVESYGLHNTGEFRANLSFVLLTRPW